MPYVSARYEPPPNPMEPEPKAGARYVVAIDENGLEWHLTEDSEVGDWLRYLEAGGVIDEAPTTDPA